MRQRTFWFECRSFHFHPVTKSTFLVSKGLLCLYDKHNNSWLVIDMKFFFSCSIRHPITRSLRSSLAIELSTRREIPYLPGSGSPPSPVKRHQVEPKFCKTLVNLWCCGAFHCGIYEQHHVVYIFSSCLVSFRFLFFFQTCIDDENNFSFPWVSGSRSHPFAYKRRVSRGRTEWLLFTHFQRAL